MKKYTIQVLLNVAERPGVMLDGWQQGDEIATYDHDLLVIAGDPYAAAEKVFAIGNRQGEDMTGRIWASDIRSLSVGDVLLITDAEHGETKALSVEGLGWEQIEDYTVLGPFVNIRGTSATSRLPIVVVH